jgi:hypothetical protein
MRYTMAVSFEKAGAGFINDGKKGPFIKVLINKDAEITSGDQLYLFKNTDKTSDKSPDYYVNVKRGQ